MSGLDIRWRFGAIETVADFLDMCDLDRWAAARRAAPTLAERSEDMDPDGDHDNG